MNRYLLEWSIKESYKYNAGSKARIDIIKALEDIEFKTVYSTCESSKFKKIKYLFNNKDLINIKKNSIVCIQFPLFNYVILKSIIRKLKKNKCKVICIIHDINSLRFGGEDNKKIKRDINMLNQFDVLIVHNNKMKEFLIKNNLKKNCITLKIFDYLIDNNFNNIDINEKNHNRDIIFAGNLSIDKSEFIYKISDNMLKYKKIRLFGANINEIKCKNILYEGKFNPTELPKNVQGDFGLVWDGDSVEKCSGMLGNYLRYNNPHKTSLYIAMGIPIIVWDKSAIADFITAEKIGIKISNLNQIEKAIENVNYDELQQNIYKIRERIISGMYIKEAIEEAIEYIS